MCTTIEYVYKLSPFRRKYFRTLLTLGMKDELIISYREDKGFFKSIFYVYGYYGSVVKFDKVINMPGIYLFAAINRNVYE